MRHRLRGTDTPVKYSHSFIGVYMVMHHRILHRRPPSVEGAACDLRTLSLWKCQELDYRLATELSQLQACAPGTVCPQMFTLPSQCTLLEFF